MSAQVLPIDAVVSDPAVRNGSPVLAGTTLRISDLAAYHTLQGFTPEQLSVQFELGLAHVQAALSFYYRHKSEIDDEIRSNSRAAEEWERELIAQGRGIVL
jgi:uncharacterized protein (DUF433 family)